MTDRRRVRLLTAVYLAAVAVAAWFGLRGRFDEIGRALAELSPGAVAAGLLLVLLGLTATGVLWLRILATLGHPLPFRDGQAIFFVGQLGKYLPGSVWSMGAQAVLARRQAVPARVTVTAGLVFLGYHVATAVVLSAGASLAGRFSASWPGWVDGLALAAGIAVLAPPVVGTLAGLAARRRVRVPASDTGVAVVCLAVAWSSYAGALVLWSPDLAWSDVLLLGGAFAAAYTVGVLVVFAPAGLGAREGVFVLLVAPVAGLAPATALALVARVVHTTADALLAGGWWLASRTRETSRDPQRLQQLDTGASRTL